MVHNGLDLVLLYLPQVVEVLLMEMVFGFQVEKVQIHWHIQIMEHNGLDLVQQFLQL